MSDSLVETVVAAVAEAKHIPPEGIHLDTALTDLGMDSLDTISMIFELENRLDISIPDDAAKSVRTVGDVVDGIRRLTEPVPPEAVPSAS